MNRCAPTRPKLDCAIWPAWRPTPWFWIWGYRTWMERTSCKGRVEFYHGPVVVLSARQRESEKIDVLDLGADDYVEKPFGIGESWPGFAPPCAVAWTNPPQGKRS